MNERIKELIGQAQCVEVWGNNPYNGLPEFEGYELDAEKFAELIVKECAGKVDNILRERKDGGGTMGDEIREHFGVEA
jgi:hypothetical protein